MIWGGKMFLCSDEIMGGKNRDRQPYPKASLYYNTRNIL